MRLFELIFAVLECAFDILSAIFLNLRTMIEKYREYKECDNEKK